MTNGSFCVQSSRRSHVLRNNRDFMKHYYDCTARLFSDGRAGDYLNELFLNAAKNGDIERVQNFLARSSRNMVVNVDVKDKETGHTAVMLAAINRHSKVVSLLLNYGADITLCNNRGQSILDLVSDSMRPLLLGSVARQGFSPRHLLQAAWQGNFQQVKKLLSSKANLDVNCTNADGLTPLLLVTRDLNLFQKIENAVMENGYHPVEVVKELLEHNADIIARDSEGKRPLHFAVHGKGSHGKDVVDVLIKNSGSAIDVPDGLSNSPLHCASKADNQPVLLALINGGADINIRGHTGRTPLHVAASHGHERTSGTLLNHGANVTITDDNGLSPVDVAKGKRVRMVLTEAWAEQTKGGLVKTKRIFSAPTNHTETESTQLDAETQPEKAVRTNTAPLQGVAKRMRKRSKSSLGNIYTIDERTKLVPTRKEPDVHMPKIPSAQKPDTSEGSSLNSSLVGKEKSAKQAIAPSQRERQHPLALPSLSVLNIQLSYVRNLQGDTQLLRAKMDAAQQPSPPRHRLRHRLSSPVLTYPRRLSSPAAYENERLRSSSTSQVSDVLHPSKLAVPSRVPPLDFHRGLTPEPRSRDSPDLTQGKLSLVQEVIDLDLLRKGGSVLAPEVREVASPRPSPVGAEESSSRTEDSQEPVQGEVTPSRPSPFGAGESSSRTEDSQEPDQGEVTPSRPSPVGAGESSSRSEDSQEPEQRPPENLEQFNKTLTFNSISRPTFWIPISEDKDIDDGKVSTSTNEHDTKSSGTSFYIDLSNLEALASGQCSACGKSLPEGYGLRKKDLQQMGEHPGTSRSIRDGVEDKELVCKSCQPRRRSNEEVFWIPFTDKGKSNVLVKSVSEARKEQAGATLRRKSNDISLEKSKLRTSNNAEETYQSLETSATGAFQNGLGELTVPFQLQRKGSPEHSSNLTGFDVSCVCDNSSGVCSCTIVRKDVSSVLRESREPVVQYNKNISLTEGALTSSVGGEIVKTQGETSPPMESTSLERPKDDCVSDTIERVDLGFSKLQEKKQNKAVFTNLAQENRFKPIIKTPLNSSSDSMQVDPIEASKTASFKSDDISRGQEGSSETKQGKSLVSEKRKLSPLKEAWTSPRKGESGGSRVSVWNPFPSPSPPEDRSAVRAPIGPRKGTVGKTRGKKAAVKSSNGLKDAQPKSKVKSQGQSLKRGKKNVKGKTKSGVKMITVHQRVASEELGLRTISDGGGSDMPEDAPCPPSVSLQSPSVLFRPFHFHSLKDKYSILSPISESPRSMPRTIDVPESVRKDRGTEEPKQDTANNSLEAATDARKSEKDHDATDLDVVDGGVISRLFGMRVPRLQLSKCDADSDVESNVPIVSPFDVSDDHQSKSVGGVDAGKAESNGNLIYGGGSAGQHLVHDEVDDEMEEIIQSQLAGDEPSNNGHQSNSRTMTNGAGEENENSFNYSTSFHQNNSRNAKARVSLVSADDESRPPSSPSRASSPVTIDNEEYSDTDSSYNTYGSTSPRPLSSASSVNSSDTYFSSPRDSSRVVTPTPDRDTGSENSVEIEYYERVLSREEDTVSSSSGSTLRPHSDTSFDSPGTSPQECADSFSSTTLVRSRLSATSRSKCSSSCEDEIVWKKGNILGKGAFGTVFCGLTNTGEMIAVKQVELNHSNIEEAEKQYEKLQEEVALLKSLHHENIVRFIGTCLDGAVVNIFMEYVPGGSIASILARFGCLDESVFCRYTKQLLSGVSYLHSNNVIHRDIKGRNILVMPSGVLKLIDFGCAKRLCLNLSMSRSNVLRSMKGTPYWMAPEVIQETGHGRKSDIWSVGCTVYEMATGKPPWSDMPPMAAIFAIGSGSLALPELSVNVSKKARDFVSKCLTRDPYLRPSADELRQHPFLKDPL